MARFASLGEDEVNKILREMNSINTHRGTTVAWNVLGSYLKEKQMIVYPLCISKED